MCLNEEYKHMHIYLAVRPIKQKNKKKKTITTFYSHGTGKKKRLRGKKQMKILQQIEKSFACNYAAFPLNYPETARKKCKNICESIK